MSFILDKIGKRMPYREDEEYVNNLIEEATEKAIQKQSTANINRHRGLMTAWAAAVVVLIIGFGIALMYVKSSPQLPMSDQSPLDEFLSTLSDEEASQLTFYEMEEIPEY